MSDLRSLMGIAPTTGAFFTGQQFAQERDTEALRQQEMASIIAKRQADMQFDAQANPLKLEQQRLQNQGLQAGLPGITADAEGKILKTRMAGETYTGDVAAAKVKNQSEITKAHAEQAAQFSATLQQAIMQTEGMPPVLRTAHMRKVFEHNKMDPNDPQLQQLMQMDPKQLGALSRAMAVQSAQYIREMDKEKLQQDGANTRQRMQDNAAAARDNAAVKRAEAKAAEKGKKGDAFREQFLKTRTAAGKHSMLVAEAATLALSADPADQAQAQRYAQMAEAIRPQVEAEHAARGGAPMIEGIPRTPTPSIAPPKLGAPGGKPQPALPSGWAIVND